MQNQFDTVIRHGKVVTPDGTDFADVGIINGRIATIGDALAKGTSEIDATGKWVLPGGIDPHAHIEQMSGMGLMNADTFETATRSAAMGGTTSVISFVAQKAGQRLSDAMADYSKRAARGAMIDYAFHMIVSDTDAPDLDSDLGQLIDAGNRSIKVFTTYNIQLDDTQILRVMSVARQHGALLCVHAENDAIIAKAKADLIAAAHKAPKYHAASHPRMAEIEAIERMCHFAEHLGQPVMIFHVSTAEGAAAVKAARQRGAPIWAETCPHYLFMTEDILDQPGLEGGKWMCSPPQRTQADQTALWAALKHGDLDLVSSDHAPYRFDDTGKLSAGANPGFHEIANGLPGLETRLPLMFDAMVSQGKGSIEDFVKMTSSKPAEIYGLPRKGSLLAGHDADITIWDPSKTVTYRENDLHDNVGYNPWVGRTIKGYPTDVILRGHHIVKNGDFHGTPGKGRKIDRPSLAVKPTTPMA